MGASLFAMLWLAGWSHAATIQFEKTFSDAGLGRGKGGGPQPRRHERVRALAALQLNGTPLRAGPSPALSLDRGRRPLLAVRTVALRVPARITPAGV